MIESSYCHSVHNLEKHSFNNYYCYLPDNSSSELKADIRAALAKNYLRYKSVDYTRARFDNFDFKQPNCSPYTKLLIEILDKIWVVFESLRNKLYKFELQEKNVITLGLYCALHRLENSYESIFFLIKNRFYFESITINRLIFEQLNYCFNLVQFTPEEYNCLSESKIKTCLSPTNINKLKDFLPNSQIGNFYSELSETAHINSKRINEYLSFDENIDDYVVSMQSTSDSIKSALILFKNVEIHGIVLEYSFYRRCNFDLVFLKEINRTLELNSERETKKIYIEFIEKLKNLMEHEEIPIAYRNMYNSLENETFPF